MSPINSDTAGAVAAAGYCRCRCRRRCRFCRPENACHQHKNWQEKYVIAGARTHSLTHSLTSLQMKWEHAAKHSEPEHGKWLMKSYWCFCSKTWHINFGSCARIEVKCFRAQAHCVHAIFGLASKSARCVWEELLDYCCRCRRRRRRASSSRWLPTSFSFEMVSLCFDVSDRIMYNWPTVHEEEKKKKRENNIINIGSSLSYRYILQKSQMNRARARAEEMWWP